MRGSKPPSGSLGLGIRLSFQCRGEVPSCAQQRLTVRLIDRFPPGKRLGEIVENAGEQIMMQMDFNSALLTGRAYETYQPAFAG